MRLSWHQPDGILRRQYFRQNFWKHARKKEERKKPTPNQITAIEHMSSQKNDCGLGNLSFCVYVFMCVLEARGPSLLPFLGSLLFDIRSLVGTWAHQWVPGILLFATPHCWDSELRPPSLALSMVPGVKHILSRFTGRASPQPWMKVTFVSF